MTEKRKRPARGEQGLDDALEDSFPASDPPSHSNPSRGTKTDHESLKEPAKHGP